MKSVQIVSISLPIKLIHAIDQSRNDISRSKFIQRMIENELEATCEQDAPRTDFVKLHSSDEVTEDNIVLGKGTELETKEIGTAKNSSISWLD